MKLIFVLNDTNYFPTHRMPIGLRALEMGWEVHLVGLNDCPEEVKKTNIKYHKVAMSRNGLNPFSEIKTLYLFYKLFKKIKPDIVHLVTIKPYLYGAIAARLTKVPCVVSAVAGLGILFSNTSFKSTILRGILKPIYKLAFNHNNQTSIFQNPNDREILVKWGVQNHNKACLIRGAGVDLAKYNFVPENEQQVPIVIFIGRLLKDKGVYEFVEASKILKQRGILVRFLLVGTPDLGNSNSVSLPEIERWVGQEVIEYLGFRKDIPALIAKSNIVTLPSFYGEGLPKVLIEAGACGRAVITTDHPGCRDAIEQDVTGLLVQIREPNDLAEKIEYLINCSDVRKKMGIAGRELVERDMSVVNVVEEHIKIYLNLIKKVDNEENNINR